MTPRLAVVLLLASATLAAPQTRFRTRVESVRVDVLVTSGGRAVEGLRAADFEIRDDGVPQTVALVTADTAPVNVTIALDTSDSLSPERLANLKAASRALVEKLKPGEAAGLITFSHVITERQAMTTGLSRVIDGLAAIERSGETSLIDATYAGLSLTEDATGRGLLVVFSDGVDTASWQRPDDVLRAARRFETVVYGVSVAQPGQSAKFLRDIAGATGGGVFEVRDNRSLETAFTRVLDEFRQRYLLSYTPTGVSKTGWHRIDVRVKRRGATVRARPGYFAR